MKTVEFFNIKFWGSCGSPIYIASGTLQFDVFVDGVFLYQQRLCGDFPVLDGYICHEEYLSVNPYISSYLVRYKLEINFCSSCNE